jgi:protein-tyrosine phosphatase
MEERRALEAHAFSGSWITPSLAVGGRLPAALTSHLLRQHGISHIVDLRSEERDDDALFRAHGLTLLSLPTEDHCAVSETMLETGVTWVREQLAAGKRVYIHCEHGIGRSVLLAWCVLVAEWMGPRAALQRIKEVRTIASPSPAQIDALLVFAKRYGRELPSWDELADIAYAHLRPPRRQSEHT